jgi:hypothetical protein
MYTTARNLIEDGVVSVARKIYRFAYHSENIKAIGKLRKP